MYNSTIQYKSLFVRFRVFFLLFLLSSLLPSLTFSATYGIAGSVKDASGNAIAGVVMNGLPGNPITDSSGNYGAFLTLGWSGTVTPTLTGYTFTPVSRTYTTISITYPHEDYIAQGTLAIAGSVKDALGNAIAGVVMNGLPGNPATDNSGNYGVYLGPGWSGIVTPTLTGYTFTPVSRTYSNLQASIGSQNYTAQGTLAIAGSVKDALGNAIAGVVMNGLPGNPATDNSGNYGVYLGPGWSGIVTPTLTGYTFTPVSRTYSNLQASIGSQNYTAQGTLAIAGSVKDALGNAIVGVVMNGLPGNPATDNNGNYGVYLGPGWSGTVTPTLTGYTFTPVSRTYSNLQASIGSQNYTAQGTLAIAGSVKDALGNAIAGVVMNGLPGNPATDNSGNYGVYLGPGWSGIVTPTLTGYTFTPVSRTYSNLQASIGSQNYTTQGKVGVANTDKTLPSEFELDQNYPNPFNPSTNISFSLPSKSFVSLKIFDALGREVSTILSVELLAGKYSRQWNAAGLPSGIYFYRLQAGSFNETKKMILLK